MKPAISVLILTKNEEANLPGCMDSVGFSDDVLVFDSHSTDSTAAIARRKGARVIRHRFKDYGSQREAARRLGRYKHPWVLALDADERPDPELVREMLEIARKDRDGGRHARPSARGGVAAYRMRRKDHFCGRWIPHATLYPTWFMRFYRPGRIRYGGRGVHEVPELMGGEGELKGHLLHYSFNKGLADWWAKHAVYAQLEAAELLRGGARGVDWAGLFGGEPMVRRRALKALSYRLPFRPLLRFMYMAVLRGGVLDGRPGLDYCRMLAFYEYLIGLNARILKSGGS